MHLFWSNSSTELDAFFASRSKDFYRNGIEQLPRRWATVVEQDGDYILD
jgi:hypothetical protein